MHRSSVFALAAGAVLALAACGDSREPLATEGELAQVRPGPGCNTSDAKSKARSHFGQPTQNEIAGPGGLIDLLIASTTEADATRYGFDVLERVELGEDVVGTAQTALDLVNAILPCIKAGATSIGPLAIFESEGAFAIRGGPTDRRPVYSHDRFSAVAPPSEPAAYDTWSEWLGLPDGDFPDPRAIIYGTKFGVGNISNEQEVGPNAKGFDWNTLPVRPFPRPADGFVGLCVGSSNSDRVQNNHAVQQGVQQGILGLYDPSDLPLSLSCAGFDQNGNPTGSTSLLRRAINILGPQPLFAAVAVGGTGGKPKGYSHQFVVVVEQAALRFLVQPSSAKIGAVITPPIQIQARTAALTPIQNMSVTLELRSNLGVPSSFEGTHTRETNELGIATFDDIVVNSSGTYRIRTFASDGDEGMTVSEALSDQFFIGTRSKK
jgi:hypothetical protein